MVRAGVVEHPAQWEVSGYHEIPRPRRRFGIVDHAALAEVQRKLGARSRRREIEHAGEVHVLREDAAVSGAF